MTVPAGQAVMKLGDGASSVRAGMGGADSMMQNRAADWTQERLSGGFRATLSLRGGGTDAKAKAKNPHLYAAKQGAVWAAKGMAAAFTGLLTTSSVMVAFEFTAHKLHPAAVAAAQVPDTLAALVLLGAVAGSVLGSLVLSKLAPSHPTAMAFVVAALFTAAQYLNIQTIDHPAWFNIAGMCAFIPPYVATALMARGGAKKLLAMMKTSGRASSASKPKGDTAKTPTKDTSKSAKKGGKTPSKTPKKGRR